MISPANTALLVILQAPIAKLQMSDTDLLPALRGNEGEQLGA